MYMYNVSLFFCVMTNLWWVQADLCCSYNNQLGFTLMIIQL